MNIARRFECSTLLTGATLLCFAAFIAQSASALTVEKAKIVREVVKVKGTGATPFGVLYWQLTEEVAQADADGRFQFTSELLPTRPNCRGFLTDGDTEVAVEVENCRGDIDGFYSAPQDRTLAQPGESVSVRSRCELGDFVTSGSFVTRGTSNDPVDFRITSSGVLTDGATGEQSWLLAGVNAGNNVADVRVSALCAKVLPSKSRDHHGHH